MRLIELFSAKAVKLGLKAKNKGEIIDQLIGLQAPHGGIFVFPTVGKPIMYVVALAVGSVVGALVLSVLKKDKH